MRKVIFLGVFLFVFALLGVYAWKALWPAAAPTTISQRLLSDEGSPQFRAVEVEALAGSVAAANALMDYHSKCHIREELSPDQTPDQFRECTNKVGYWTTIALENGSVPAAQRQTNFLLESKKCHDIYRAEFWFNRIRTHLKPDPIFLHSVREEVAEKKKSCTW